MKFGWLVAGAALSSVIVACSQAAPERGTDEGATGTTAAAIQGGTEDTTHTFAVGLCMGNGPGQCQGICSGALIAPNVVVTARHCVSESPELIDCSENPTFGRLRGSVYVTTGNTVFQTTTGWHATKNVVLPDDDHVCGHDIALLILEDVVDASEAKPITPGVQYLMTDKRYGKSFTAIGYGNTNPDNGAGTRRIKQSIPLACVPGSTTMDCPDAINDAEFIGGDGTCQGDSGSSAYDYKTFANTPLSWGVLSRGGVSDDGTECKGSLYTRLDAWRDLIVDTVKSASENWTLYGKPTPDWTVYVPPAKETDAGTDAGSKPTKEFGEACSSDTDCVDGVCIDGSDGQVCSQSCSDEDGVVCPDGYSCADSVCIVTPPSQEPTSAATVNTTKSGCSVGPTGAGPAGSATVALGTFAALGLILGRRRNRDVSVGAKPKSC